MFEDHGDDLLGAPKHVEIEQHGSVITISGAIVSCINSRPRHSAHAETTCAIDAPFSARQIHITYPGLRDPPFSLREWYINAPTNNHFLHDRIRRRKTTIYEHGRGKGDKSNDRYELLEYSQSTIGCLRIDAGTFRFMLECVPKSFPPNWSQKLMIEYRDEWGFVPDEATRQGIAETIGYLLGRELILVGETTLVRKGYLSSATSKSLGRPNIRHLCQNYPRYPIDLRESGKKFASTLVKAMSAYAKRKDHLPISECLSRYWLAVELPDGLNVVVLASAIEYMTNAWFKSQDSKSQGMYLAHDKYRELLSPEIDSLTLKLGKIERGTPILKRIQSANNYGANDRTSSFFTELGVTLVEEDSIALRGRNKYAHGGRVDSAEARRVWGRYSSLFHRMMLRLLEIESKT